MCVCVCVYSTLVWNVSRHVEYLKNQLHSLHMTCQPMRADLIVHAWRGSLPWGNSIGSEMPMMEGVKCLHLMQGVFRKHHITQCFSAPPPTPPRVHISFLATSDFSLLKGKRFQIVDVIKEKAMKQVMGIQKEYLALYLWKVDVTLG